VVIVWIRLRRRAFRLAALSALRADGFDLHVVLQADEETSPVEDRKPLAAQGSAGRSSCPCSSPGFGAALVLPCGLTASVSARHCDSALSSRASEGELRSQGCGACSTSSAPGFREVHAPS
jgi:hypothetical protein